MYKPADNLNIKTAGRLAARGRLWFVWQQLLLIFLINFAVSYLLELICGSPLDVFTSGDVPREYNFTGTTFFYILTIIANIAVVPITYGMMRNNLLTMRGKMPDRITPIMFEKYKDWPAFSKVIGVYLLSGVKVFLWSLLFIVPGIIKAISLALTPYLLYDEPELSIKDTLKKSEDMMRGFKGKFFLLVLTFIGWQIVSSFTLFILDVWIIPYMMFTFAAFYDEMRRCFYDGNDPARPVETVREVKPADVTPPFDGRMADDIPADTADNSRVTDEISAPPAPESKPDDDLRF